MKDFLTILVAAVVLMWAFTFFFAGLFIQNIYALATAIAVVFAIGIKIMLDQDKRIEDLEKSVKELKEKK